MKNKKPIFGTVVASHILAFTLALASSLTAQADTTIGVHVATYHLNRDADFNEFNAGLYVVRAGWTAGAYRNSIRRVSTYAGYTHNRVFGTPVDVTVGAVSGYLPAPVIPMLVPSIKLHNVRLGILLPFEKKGGGLHVAVEF